jgi:methyl-accepting chemotaxis protein
MFKNMKLGAKIGLGFASLILLACLLGGLAVYNMKTASTNSTKLATEYVPEVKIATELRAAANRVMYQMRGYALTTEDSYYEAAQKELEAVDKNLKEADELADKAIYLKALKGQVEEATAAIDEYKKLLKLTD